MAYEARPNSGTLFKETERKSDKHPEYEGEYLVECPHCNASHKGWVKAWVKEGKKGKFFSLAFKARSGRQE